MTPVESRNLIASVGGDRKFADLLGLPDKPGVLQRINNWKRRGIPAAVVVEHYDALQKLRAESGRRRHTS